MEEVLFTIVIILITWQWGDWRNWKQYYSTILFWALGNTIYCYLTFEKPLWEFNTYIPASLANMLMAIIIFPCVCLLFLPHFPRQSIVNKILYILSFVFIFSFVEWWALKIDHFAHFNGWAFIYSVIFNIGMFILIKIHYNKPPWAWLISFIIGAFIMIYFRIPL